MEKEKKLIMITGANRGIGFGMIESLLKSNPEYNFIMCARSMERGKKAFEELKKKFPDVESRVTLHELNIESSKSIDDFVEWIKNTHTIVHCLFNNAGICSWNTEITEAMVKEMVPTNYYGTVELTEKMFPLLPNESKIIFMTSRLGTHPNVSDSTISERLRNPKLTRSELKTIVDDFCTDVKNHKYPPDRGDYIIYGLTKLALNYYTKIFCEEKEVKDKNIQIYACHPGCVRTEMWGPSAPMSIEEGTVCPCYLINLPWKIDDKYQGKYFNDCKVCGFD